METQTSSSSVQYNDSLSSEEDYSKTATQPKRTTPQDKTQPTDHDTAVSSNNSSSQQEDHYTRQGNTNDDNTLMEQDIIAKGSEILESIYQGNDTSFVVDTSAHPLLPISLLCSFILEKQRYLEQKDMQIQRLLELVCSEIKEDCHPFNLIQIVQVVINELVAYYQHSMAFKVLDIILSRVFGIVRKKREVEYRENNWSYYRFQFHNNTLSIKEQICSEDCLVSFQPQVEKMDGPQLLFYCFQAILESCRTLVPLFLQVLKETRLPNSIGDRIIGQVFKSMKYMELQEIQGIFYKLLHFANGNRSTCELFFTNFIEFVSQLEQQCEMLDYYDSIHASQDFGIRLHSYDPCTLLSFESSILKQFIFVCRNESSFGRNFIKLFRKNIKIRNNIGLSFLLVIAHNRSLCEEVFQTIISVLSSEAKDKTQFYCPSRDIPSLAWMMFPERQRPDSLFWSQILTSLEAIAKSAVDKWNFLMAPLIEFCIYALDHEELFHFQEYGYYGLCPLCDIIQLVFSSESGSQAPLLDAIFRNLLNQRIETNMGFQAIVKMECQCFASIFHECFTTRVKNFLLEDLKYMQRYQGFHFIQCLLPILRINTELCNVTITSLKKCLSCNQTSSRLLALDGLLALVQMSAGKCGREDSLSLEMSESRLRGIDLKISADELVLLLLRCCSSQNYIVRRNAYRKLSEFSCEESICRHIFSMIEEHWNRYLDWSKTPVVQFALCVDSHTGFMTEPISELLQCYLRLCDFVLSGSEKNAIVEKLCDSIVATDLLDMEIHGQEIDLRMEGVARKKRNICRCLYHVVNVLILQLVCKEEFLSSCHEIDTLNLLFQWKENLQHILKSAGMAFEVDIKSPNERRQTDDKLLISTQSFQTNVPKGFHSESFLHVVEWHNVVHRTRQIQQMSSGNLALFAKCIGFLHQLVADELCRICGTSVKSCEEPTEEIITMKDRIPVLLCICWNDFELRCNNHNSSRPYQPLQNMRHSLQWLSTCSTLSMEDKQKIILETCNLLKLLHGEDNQHHEEWCPIAYLLETWNKAVVDMLLDCRWNEANVLLHILITIKDWYREDNKIPQFLETCSQEAISQVTFEDGHCLYKLKYLTWSTLETKISCLGELSNNIYRKLGDIGKDDDDNATIVRDEEKHMVIGSEAIDQLLLCTNARCFELLQDVNWILRKTRTQFSKKDGDQALQTLLSKVVFPVLLALKNLARSHGMHWSTCQSVLKSLILSYKVLHQVFSIQLHCLTTTSSTTTTTILQLANFVWTEYTPVVYLFIPFMNQYETNHRAKPKAAKESRWIPQLIFLVEQLETSLIRLSKKTTNTHFLQGWKRSTARDFKILDEPTEKKSKTQ